MEKDSEQNKLPDISDFRRQQKTVRPGFRKNLKNYIPQYTDNTGIHGFKYLGEQKRQIFERIWWVISFGICLFICTLLILDVWRKWETTPVLVSFSKTPTSVWKIPFPAVTICPYTKSKHGMYNYTESLNKFTQNDNFTETEMKNFSASSLVCNHYLYTEGAKAIGLDAIDHITRVAPQLKDIFLQCRWDLLIDNCTQTFRTVLTEDGLCYTSNMLARNELFKDNVYIHYDMANGTSSDGWSLEHGYPDTAKKDSFPRRAKFSGFTASQVFTLTDFEQDLDYSCKGALQGFKIILHNPAEMPRATTNYLQAPLDEELLIITTPDMMTTSSGIRDYDPHKRECFFASERELSFFRVYTQQNCEFECLTNYTLSKCGCVAFYMPYEKSTPICGPGSLECMFEAQSELIDQTVDYDVPGLNKKSDENGFVCDCLPACSSLSYNAEFSQTHFNWKEILIAHRESFDQLPGVYFSRLTIFFKEPQFIPAQRNELFDLAGVLANCGGILGLFTGFSFISLVEIIYFLSLRLICNVKRYGKHYWSGGSIFESCNATEN